MSVARSAPLGGTPPVNQARRLITCEGLQALIDALAGGGYQVLGPTARVECEFSFTGAPGSETARDNGFATHSLPAPRESVVDFLRGMSA